MNDNKNNEIQGMFDGPVSPVLLKLSLPILAGMVFQLFYNITDTFFVSRIDLTDPSYVGGVGLVFPLVFLFIALGNGLAIGVSSLTARAIGEKNQEILNKTAESGLFIGLLLSLSALLTMPLFGKTLISLLGATGDYHTHGYNYLIYLLPAALFIFTGSALTGILQGEGLMKHVMVSMILGTVTNIILDPVLIFGFHLNVKGAALATAIGQGFSFIYILGVFIGNKSSVKIAWKIENISRDVIKKVIVIGLPQAMAMIMMAVSFLFFNKLVISIDPLALTAFSLFGRMEQLVLMPGLALGAAVITMAGQNAGRDNFTRMKSIMHTTWISGTAVTTVLALLMIAAARYIYPLFSGIPEVVHYAVRQTYTMEIFYFCALVGITNRSFFQAIGYPVPAFFLTLTRTILLSLPLAWIFAYKLEAGIPGIWWGMNLASILTATTSIILVNLFIRQLETGKRRIHRV